MSKGPESATSAPDRELYSIPARSIWFHWDEIHDTERKALPEFFDGGAASKSPRVYKEYRDFIINKYREDPSKRLTLTEIRKSIIGDVSAIQKVYSFLDKWGLINFSAAAVRCNTGSSDAGGDGFPPVVVEEGPPSGLKVVAHPNSNKALSLPSRSCSKVGGVGFRLPPLTSYSDVYGDDKFRLCVECGEKCDSSYYESKKGGFIFCTKCFKNENAEGLKPADDPILIEGTDDNAKLVSNGWSDVETLHLLEAITAKKNDWALVSDQVRRIKLDCVARLIQLPLGDHTMGYKNGKYDTRNNLGNHKYSVQGQHGFGNLDKKPNHDSKQLSVVEKKECAEENAVEPSPKRRCLSSLPFATDSLMKQVADLSAVAGPYVAAAAAEAAITALCEEHPYARMVFKTNDDDCNEEFASNAQNSNLGSYTDSMYTEEQAINEKLNTTEMPEAVHAKDFGHLTFKLRASFATAFGSVAAQAKMLADQEEREIEHLLAHIVEMQLKKIHCKIKHFDELESIMEEEYSLIQEQKESILTEWISLLEKANTTGNPKWREYGFSKIPRDNIL